MPEPAFGNASMSGDRLTPLPEHRPGTILLDARPDARQLKSWRTENMRRVRRALDGRTIIPGYSLREHRSRVLASSPLRYGKPSWRAGEPIKIPSGVSTIVYDQEGAVVLVVMRRYLSGQSFINMTRNTQTLMDAELNNEQPAAQPPTQSPSTPSAPPSTDGLTPEPHKGQRHCNDIYLKSCGVWGDKHYVLAWHPIGHQVSNPFNPSAEVLGYSSVTRVSLRLQFLDACFPLATRINHLVSLVHPEFSKLLRAARPFFQDRPATKALLPFWHTNFLGHAVLMNKQSGEHLDVSGLPYGWDAIVTSGDYGRGGLFLHDLNIETPLGPGDLVMFDGTFLRHLIKPFDGPQRMSHVFFVHKSVFAELRLSTRHLCDPTLHAIQQKVAKVPAPKKSKPTGLAKRSQRSGKRNSHPTLS